MVKVILRGGLGNQMFQYAAGLDLALARKTQLVLDTTYLNDRFPRRQITYHRYDLDIFKIEPQFTLLSKVSRAVPVPGLWLGFDLVGHLFDGSLWGFYQSEKYFKDHEEAVRTAFRFRHALEGEAKKLQEEIKNTNAVSIHVRRGDYTLPKYKKIYGATDAAYYEKAIEYVSTRVESPQFFIFSDDIDWCKKNIKAPVGSVYVTRSSEGPKASFHLQLMSLCKHNIIANSTFSWWGAWLNANPEKMIVAPRRWLMGSREDIVPASWTQL